MKKIKEAGKRIIASFMIVLTLSFTVIGDYVMPPVETEAAAAATASLLMALIEAVMGSIGLTFSTQADLKECADGFQYGVDNGLVYEASNGVEIFSKIKDFLLAPNKTVDQATLEALQEALYNQNAGKLAESSDVGAASSGVAAGSANFKFMSSFTASNLLFGGRPGYKSNNPSYGEMTVKEDPSYYYFVISSLFSDGRIKMHIQYPYVTPFTYPYGVVYDASSQSFYFVDKFGNKGVDYGYCCDLSYSSTYDSYYQSYVNDLLYADRMYSSKFCLTGSHYSDVGKNLVFIKPGIRFFNSAAALRNALLLSDYAPTSPVYGLTSSAGTKPFTKNEDGTLTLKDLQPSITKAVESAVSSAISANPSITQEDLNAMVAQILVSNTEIKDEIKDDIGESTSFLAGILAEIKAIVTGNTKTLSGLSEQVTAVQDSVSKIGAGSTDGTSALKEPVESIADQFTVIDGGASDPGDGNKDDEPDVWAVGPVASIKLLQPLFTFLTKPLKIITNSLRQIWTQIKLVPGNISSALHEWVFPALQNQLDKLDRLIKIVGDGFTALPDNFKAALENLKIEVPEITIPEIKVPEINLPEAINYTSAFSRIIELLESFFVIDSAALASAASGFDAVWEDKFPFGSRLHAILGGFSFPDNFDYPVIKMQTPDILKQFYKQDYIVLCDFSQFKTQCVWVRNLCRCLLWFSFALSFINHLRTQFHVG